MKELVDMAGTCSPNAGQRESPGSNLQSWCRNGQVCQGVKCKAF